jgi:DNA mismatch repair ATPase MutS
MCYCIRHTGTSLVSLYELLNQCKTAAGSATLRNWLLRPLREVAVIQRRQGTVQALVSQPQVLEGLRESRKAGLKAFPDISRLGKPSKAPLWPVVLVRKPVTLVQCPLLFLVL